jgi:hypothetical protein
MSIQKERVDNTSHPLKIFFNFFTQTIVTLDGGESTQLCLKTSIRTHSLTYSFTHPLILYLNTKYMFVPITSEITIERGMVVKEIATGRLFEVGARLNNREEVWGDDPWELTEINSGNRERTAIALGYLELAEKFLAEVEE